MVEPFGGVKARVRDMRHTNATLLLEAGSPVSVVSAQLGHSRTSITMDIYAHVTNRMLDDAQAQKQQVFGGPAEDKHIVSTHWTKEGKENLQRKRETPSRTS